MKTASKGYFQTCKKSLRSKKGCKKKTQNGQSISFLKHTPRLLQYLFNSQEEFNKTVADLRGDPLCRLGHTEGTKSFAGGTWCTAIPSQSHLLYKLPLACAVMSLCWVQSNRHRQTWSPAPWWGRATTAPHRWTHYPTIQGGWFWKKEIDVTFWTSTVWMISGWRLTWLNSVESLTLSWMFLSKIFKSFTNLLDENCGAK